MAAILIIPQEAQNIMAKLSETQQNNIIRRLRVEMVRKGINYDGIVLLLKEIRVQEDLYVNSLTETELIDAVFRIDGGILLLNEIIKLHLGLLDKPSS